MSQIKIAIVTGGNKGIGLEIVKGLVRKFNGIVYLTARNEQLGLKAVKDLEKENLKANFHQLDIDNSNSIKQFASYLKKKYDGFDLLVNNAAINYMHENFGLPIAEQVSNTIRVNFTGTLNVCNELFPLIRENGKVVNISSRMGLLKVIQDDNLRALLYSQSLTVKELCLIMNDYVKSAVDGSHEKVCPCPYSMSKVGMNALTRIHQRNFYLENMNKTVSAATPGYVATDMTKYKGVLTAEQGAVTPLKLCFLEEGEPKGMFWGDLKVEDY